MDRETILRQWREIWEDGRVDPVRRPLVETASRIAQATVSLVDVGLGRHSILELNATVAVAVYRYLTHEDVMDLPTPDRPRCRVDEPRIPDWLLTPTGNEPPVAEQLALDDSFYAGAKNVAARLSTLLDRAQTDGLLIADGHRIALWHGGDAALPDGYVVAVQPDDGPHLAHGPVSDATLLSPERVGPSAAAHALHEISRIANTLLTTQHTQHVAAVTATFRAIHPPRAHHAFTASPAPATDTSPTNPPAAGPAAPPPRATSPRR